MDANMQGVIGDYVPSIRGESGERHFVTPWLRTEPEQYVTVRAINTDDETFISKFSWSGDGEPVPGEPTKRRITRWPTGHFRVGIRRLSDGEEVSSLNIWVIWATGTPLHLPDFHLYLGTETATSLDGTPNLPQSQLYAGQNPQDEFAFKFVVSPIGLVVLEDDIPNFTGQMDFSVPVPDGSHVLEGGRFNRDGAAKKWDVSRRMQIIIKNPSLIPWQKFPNSQGRLYQMQPLAEDIAEPFPAGENAEITGNDDSGTDDEDNNPYVVNPGQPNLNYAHPVGELRSIDRPRSVMLYSGQAAGVEYEELDYFQEFVRLQIGTKWYRVSDWVDWHFYLKLKSDGGGWKDNGSRQGLGHP